jgi:gamma-glutamyltranspeptidase / glutathione hydrolase
MRRFSAAISLALSLALPVAGDPETGPGDRLPTGRDHGLRSSVIAPNAAAATAHPLATQVAIEIGRAHV